MVYLYLYFWEKVYLTPALGDIDLDQQLLQRLPGANELTHCGLVMPYGDIELGQYWLR